MTKKLKIINIVLLCLSGLCLGVSTYLRSFKQKLPLPAEETQIILKYNQIGLALKNIGIIFMAACLLTILLSVFQVKRVNRTQNHSV